MPLHLHYATPPSRLLYLRPLRNTQQIHAQNSVSDLSYRLLNDACSTFVEPEHTRKTFEQMYQRDDALSSWSRNIATYTKNKQFKESLQLFHLMNRHGFQPDRSSLISALSSCSNLSKLIQGKQLHCYILKTMSVSDIIFSNILIHVYSKCGDLGSARQMFDKIPERDLVSWTSLLSGYSQNGFCKEAWEFFSIMHSKDLGFNHYGFSVTAKACAELGEAEKGETLHGLVIKTGFESHLFVASALLDMYSKCRKIACARLLFDEMPEPNVVSWTSMISGYVQCDAGEEAVQLFRRQIQQGVRPDPFSLSCILTACSNLPALEMGKQIHAHIIKSGNDLEVFASNSLIGMYSKCGFLSDAQKIYDSMKIRNVISFTSMIAGCAQHGRGVEALEIFKHMREANLDPNSITFIAILTACSRSGMVDAGIWHFRSMSRSYGIEASDEHYTCVIDLLSRAGRVKEAEEFMGEMHLEPSASAWGALLSGCRAVGESELGLKCAEELFRLEPNSASNHILLANMYAAQGKWDEVGRIRGLMKEKGIKKETGYSWIEVGKEVSVFAVGDNGHPQSDLIYVMLEHLSFEMKEEDTR